VGRVSALVFSVGAAALLAAVSAPAQKTDWPVPEVSARLEQIGGEARGSTPEEMKSRVAAELQR